MCSGYGARPYNQTYKTDVSYAIDQNLSIYIPYMEKEYATTEYIQRIFKSLDIGHIDYVHFENNAAIIYMKRWYNNITVYNLQEKIRDGHRQARLVHDDPDYWVLLENNDFKKIIAAQVMYIETLNATMNQMVGKLEQLSKKFEEFEKKYSKNDIYPGCATNIYKNNSCCGAASDAWVPSYPSNDTSNWREWHISKL